AVDRKPPAAALGDGPYAFLGAHMHQVDGSARPLCEADHATERHVLGQVVVGLVQVLRAGAALRVEPPVHLHHHVLLLRLHPGPPAPPRPPAPSPRRRGRSPSSGAAVAWSRSSSTPSRW